MKEAVFSVLSQTLIARDTYRLTMAGDVSAITSPGQFVQIRLDSFFLRRPISVCLRDEDTLTLIYKVVGGGTKALAELPAGAKLDLLTGLGNGFDTSKSGQTPLLVGGGVGAAPLLWLCRTLVEEGKKPAVLLGFNTAEEVFLEEDFRAMGADVTVVTMDGSRGKKGLVTEHLPSPEMYDFYYTCGPAPMMKALHGAAAHPGQISLESRMGCGFGACMGCTCQTKNGPVRICHEGPVLESEAIVW
ncbi:MAG: dihydroorotate dehydrogenase electron transfer subunit [Eubacteriales bacterium]|nr:dihydroorotate dehydrogenase electron transfer subunit [Eubacteriales bacterium]